MAKIIIISYFFAPANMIGAVRMTKLAKYFVKKGYEVEVLTSPNNSILFQKENNGFDEILYNDIKNVNVTRIEHGRLYKKLAKLLRNRFFNPEGNSFSMNSSSVKKNNKLKKKVLHYAFYWVLMLQDIDFAIQGKKYINMRGGLSDSIIISTYGPLASHLLAGKIRKGNKWIADFRDPIAQYEDYKFEHWLNRKIEKRIVKNCDAVVGVTDSYLMSILSDSIKDKMVITNGYDSEDLQYVSLNSNNLEKKLRFCYTGTLYSGMRDIRPFYTALQTLSKEGKINLDNIELTYAGPQGDLVLELANNYGVKDIINNRGFVPRYESLAIQNESDVIIVLTWNLDKNGGYLPGKFLEHLMFKKEIFGYVSGPYKDSDLKKIIKSLNIGECFEETEENLNMKIKNYIEELYKGKFHTYDKEKIEKYSYDSISNQYLQLIDSMKRG